MAEEYGFNPVEMNINENLGYPRAYKKLCRDRGFGPYNHGPPFTFIPYALQEDEAEKAIKLDQMFPIIDPRAKPTTNPKIFVSVLWKQLSHLGNAGFDPAVIRVDAYGNVLYYHADSASPLKWGIDHWFPCSRGGLTVVSNLRILQRQACKRKKNKLEFLVPWWDFQSGISVNQFLSIFASSNSDFRHRAFSFLFSEGEDHELSASQVVDSHSFPQHFFGLKEDVGLAPAAIVESRRESHDAFALRQMDINRKLRPMSPAIVASRKSYGNVMKENKDPEYNKNPYQVIAMARDSLKQREENTRMQGEIQKLDNEMNEMKLTNEEDGIIIEELELTLTKCRKNAEKCRRIAESQCSYRTMLEKMIRDTVHQSTVYKEHIRLNQAATNAVKARLEVQKAICDAAEKDLYKMYKQKDELDKEIRPEWGQGRKRSRIDDASTVESDSECLPNMPKTSLQQELRVLSEEEKMVSEASLFCYEDQKQDEEEEELKITSDNTIKEKLEEHNRSLVALEEENSIERKLEIEGKEDCGISIPVLQETETAEDEESRKQHGKGKVEKWLQMLLENGHNLPQETNRSGISETEEINKQLNQKYPQQGSKELRVLLEEEKTVSEAILFCYEDQKQDKEEEELKITSDNTIKEKLEEHNRSHVALEEENSIEQKLEIEGKEDCGIFIPVLQETETVEDEESRKQRGKGKVEKWLQMLLENDQNLPQETNKSGISETKEINKQLNQKYPQQELKISEVSDLKYKEKQLQLVQDKNGWIQRKDSVEDETRNVTCTNEGNVATSFEGVERKEHHQKEKRLVRSESARFMRRIPSSPSLLLGMRKGVNCIRKKPTVNGTDDGSRDLASANSFFRSPFKTIKRAAKF